MDPFKKSEPFKLDYKYTLQEDIPFEYVSL